MKKLVTSHADPCRQPLSSDLLDIRPNQIIPIQTKLPEHSFRQLTDEEYKKEILSENSLLNDIPMIRVNS